jgi:hypothetical protein
MDTHPACGAENAWPTCVSVAGSQIQTVHGHRMHGYAPSLWSRECMAYVRIRGGIPNPDSARTPHAAAVSMAPRFEHSATCHGPPLACTLHTGPVRMDWSAESRSRVRGGRSRERSTAAALRACLEGALHHQLLGTGGRTSRQPPSASFPQARVQRAVAGKGQGFSILGKLLPPIWSRTTLTPS